MNTRRESRFIHRSFLGRFFNDEKIDIEEIGRKQLFALSLFLLGIPLFIVGIHHVFIHGGVVYGVIDVAISIVLAGFLMIMNRTRHTVMFFRAVSLIIWLLLCYWVVSGPMNGYASIWAIFYPNFVFFMLGKKEGLIWSMTMVALCAFIFFNPLGLPLPFHYTLEYGWRHLGTMVIVLFLTFYYESVRVGYKEALESDRNELRYHRNNLEFLVETRTGELQQKNIELNGALEQLRERTVQYQKAQKDKEIIQDQLVQSQKMEAVGTLAGGLAHDFNNYLGGIIGSFNLIEIYLRKETLNRRNEIEEYLALGVEASKKSSIIIKQLLALSRKQDISLVPVDINTSLRNIHAICRNSFTKSIAVDFRLADMPIMVMAEPVGIEQVILNLCINASHAMTIMRGRDDVQGGVLTVTGDIVNADEALNTEEPRTAAAASWARIRVTDTGVGIPEENLPRIFDPFFTTKKSGGNSGLGLATSYGIIKDHGGFIGVRSTEKEGSTFSVYLPLVGQDVKAEQDASAHSALSVKAGNGHILVIDDENYIRDVVRGFIESYGWKSLTAATPERGLELYRERRRDIAAVLLDLSMPGRSGLDLYRDLAAVDPGIKVILCSGLIDDETAGKAREAGIHKILQKPFDADTLMRMLQELLDGPGEDAPDGGIDQ